MMTMMDESGIFPRPDGTEVEFLLRELNWGAHFIGIEMSPGAGNRDVYLYSLSEAERFLRRGMTGTGLTTGGGGTLVWFDFDAFVAWIRSEIGDALLADALEQRGAKEETFFEKVQVASHLLGTRVSQLREESECIEKGQKSAD
jgi:hypothetical protein